MNLTIEPSIGTAWIPFRPYVPLVTSALLLFLAYRATLPAAVGRLGPLNTAETLRCQINVPAIRGAGFLRFVIDSFRALRLQPQWIQEGYEKVSARRGPILILICTVVQFGTRIFKTPHLGNWIVVVSDPEQIDEMRMAAQDVLCFRAAVDEVRGFHKDVQLIRYLRRHSMSKNNCPDG